MDPGRHHRQRTDRAAVLLAATAYMLAVFVVAFAIGAIRVTLVAPRTGAMAAVALEAPLVLAVSWWCSGWSTRRFRIAPDPATRIWMGLAAFALLMILELAVATLAFGERLGPYFARFVGGPGLLGLAAQLGFAAIPWIQVRRPQLAHPS